MTALVISISCCFNQNRVLCVYFDEIKVNLTSDLLLGLSFFQEFKIQALLIKVQFPQTVMLLMMQMAVRQWSSFFFFYTFFFINLILIIIIMVEYGTNGCCTYDLTFQLYYPFLWRKSLVWTFSRGQLSLILLLLFNIYFYLKSLLAILQILF